MLSKDTFCKALSLIKEQDNDNNDFTQALQKASNGPYVFGSGNKYLDTLLLVLKETTNDKYGYIDWWLYEAEPHYKLWDKESTKNWVLETPEALYDFIVNEA